MTREEVQIKLNKTNYYITGTKNISFAGLVGVNPPHKALLVGWLWHVSESKTLRFSEGLFGSRCSAILSAVVAHQSSRAEKQDFGTLSPSKGESISQMVLCFACSHLSLFCCFCVLPCCTWFQKPRADQHQRPAGQGRSFRCFPKEASCSRRP